jgi:hypothetical protein
MLRHGRSIDKTGLHLAREVGAIVARDFYPGEFRKQMEAALADTERANNARFAPDEPHPAQRRIHHLDVGGIPIAEAPGLATIMAGTRKLQPDDDALLKAMTPVIDSLYAECTSADTKG